MIHYPLNTLKSLQTLKHPLILCAVGGASSDQCSEAYGGPAPFSEIETKTMAEYIKSLGSKLFAYVAFHSYSQLLLFPYGHTEEHLANYDESVSQSFFLVPMCSVWNCLICQIYPGMNVNQKLAIFQLTLWLKTNPK